MVWKSYPNVYFFNLKNLSYTCMGSYILLIATKWISVSHLSLAVK